MNDKPVIESRCRWDGSGFIVSTRIMYADGRVENLEFKVGPHIDPIKAGDAAAAEHIKSQGDNTNSDTTDEKADSDADSDSEGGDTDNGEESQEEAKNQDQNDSKAPDSKDPPPVFWQLLSLQWGLIHKPEIVERDYK